MVQRTLDSKELEKRWILVGVHPRDVPINLRRREASGCPWGEYAGNRVKIGSPHVELYVLRDNASRVLRGESELIPQVFVTNEIVARLYDRKLTIKPVAQNRYLLEATTESVREYLTLHSQRIAKGHHFMHVILGYRGSERTPKELGIDQDPRIDVTHKTMLVPEPEYKAECFPYAGNIYPPICVNRPTGRTVWREVNN